MPEVKLASEPCTIREEMVESIKAVMQHLIVLHCHEIQAVRNWDIDTMERIDQEVDSANSRRDSLLDRLKSHVNGHCCQEPRIQTMVGGYEPSLERQQSRVTDRPDDEPGCEIGHQIAAKE